MFSIIFDFHSFKNCQLKKYCNLSRLVLLCMLSSACTHLVQEQDSGPKKPLAVDHIPEPTPRYEPRTAAGNFSPYTVLGKTYHVLADPSAYSERGYASWYGNKFHGKRTSNGELYDMYAMTAAHKTLPIPSYVRVHNLDNGRSVIVRVNDRGPFHEGRIIDLSYTAARKLGLAQAGTAPVRVDYIDPKTYQAAKEKKNTRSSSDRAGQARAPTPVKYDGGTLPKDTYLQVGAFSKNTAAQVLKKKLANLTSYPIKVVQVRQGFQRKTIYRVKIGPLADNNDVLALRELLHKNAFPSPHLVQPK